MRKTADTTSTSCATNTTNTDNAGLKEVIKEMVDRADEQTLRFLLHFLAKRKH